jgi:RNA polymerase sigma factor (sigma-70 family)
MTVAHINPCQNYPNEESLFMALKKRVNTAFDCLYKRGYQKVVSSLCNSGANLEDAQDAFQDGIAAFALNIDKIDFLASPTTILYRYVKNKWIDGIRKDKGHRVPIDDKFEKMADTPDAIHAMIDKEFQQKIRNAVTKLESSSQRIIEMDFFEGKSNKEIASELGIAETSVSNQKSRAIRYLRIIINSNKP